MVALFNYQTARYGPVVMIFTTTIPISVPTLNFGSLPWSSSLASLKACKTLINDKHYFQDYVQGPLYPVAEEGIHICNISSAFFLAQVLWLRVSRNWTPN